MNIDVENLTVFQALALAKVLTTWANIVEAGQIVGGGLGLEYLEETSETYSNVAYLATDDAITIRSDSGQVPTFWANVGGEAPELLCLSYELAKKELGQPVRQAKYHNSALHASFPKEVADKKCPEVSSETNPNN